MARAAPYLRCIAAPQNQSHSSLSPQSRAAVPPLRGRAYSVLDTTQLLHAVWLSLAQQAPPERVQLSFRSTHGKHH